MSPDAPAIDVRNLREFLRDAVQEALARRKVGIEDHTEHYVVNLLAMCARTEALFDATAGGPRLKPLALMLVDAASAPDGEQRSRALQRLVDALDDVSEMSWRSSDRDLLRLYEVWLRTGSPPARALLREQGVTPTVVPVGRAPH